MSWLLYLLAVLSGIWSCYLMPASIAEARSPLAPYQCVRSLLFGALGLVWWLWARSYA